jgi:hypothetical protein
MTTNPVPESQGRWRVSQVCLGLFILWQVFFVVGNNVLQFIQDCNELEDEETVRLISLLTLDLPNEKGPGGQLLQTLVRWEEATGQEQSWSMFAPAVPERFRFLRVQFHWEDGRPPVVFPSATEPLDLARFFRWGQLRLRKYESHVGVHYSVWDAESIDDARKRWRRLNQRMAHKQAEHLPCYLMCRWRDYQVEHPECPTPGEIQLHIVCWEIPPPDGDPWFWKGPIQMAFARLRLNPDGSRNGAVQPYNPLSKQFDDLQ